MVPDRRGYPSVVLPTVVWPHGASRTTLPTPSLGSSSSAARVPVKAALPSSFAVTSSVVGRNWTTPRRASASAFTRKPPFAAPGRGRHAQPASMPAVLAPRLPHKRKPAPATIRGTHSGSTVNGSRPDLLKILRDWKPIRPTVFLLDDPMGKLSPASQVVEALSEGSSHDYRFPVRLVITSQAIPEDLELGDACTSSAS